MNVSMPVSSSSAIPSLWTAAEAAAAVNGRFGPGNTRGDWMATGVSIDSRTVAAGDLFIALKGPNHDGHAFVAAALAQGAVAAMVSDPPPGVAADAPLLVVEDTFAALQDLGAVARLRSRAMVIAVTGSVGKTGSKEALAACFAAMAPTYATEGSLNNHWGVPLSLARMPAATRFGVFELGMNHAGELGPLSRMVRPDVALITTIAPAHMAFFASLDAVADAKAEIFAGMGPGGAVVLNRDIPHYGRLLAAARTQGVGRIVSFGAHCEATLRLEDCTLFATCSSVSAICRNRAPEGVRLDYCLSLAGRHWVLNSLGILATVIEAGGDPAIATRTFSRLRPPKGRGVRRRVAAPNGSFLLIDESYNASPAAMEAGLAVLAGLEPGAGGRRLAVLGDMRELGDAADAFHAGLAGPLAQARVDQVYCCGPHMRALWERLPAACRGAWAQDSTTLAPQVAAAVKGGDVVMVKGSAGSRMAEVVAALTGLETAAGGTRDDNDTTPVAFAAGSA